jgi:hypothetical protein
MTMSNFPAVSWREQVVFEEMMMMSALYWTNTLSRILIVLLSEITVSG